MADERTTFWWDFFGPSAQATGRHFRVHLDEFIAREKLTGCETDEESLDRGHWAAVCRTPAAHVETIRRALRPRRSSELATSEPAANGTGFPNEQGEHS